jgi:hypothetical protein
MAEWRKTDDGSGLGILRFMVKQIVRYTVIFAAIVSLLAAADVSGKWKGPLDGGEGEVQFMFKVEGDALSGTMSGADGKAFPLTGKLDGDKVSFTVESEYQGTPIKLVVNGTVSGEEMKLNVATADGGWSSTVTAKKQQE